MRLRSDRKVTSDYNYPEMMQALAKALRVGVKNDYIFGFKSIRLGN